LVLRIVQPFLPEDDFKRFAHIGLNEKLLKKKGGGAGLPLKGIEN